MRVFLRTPLWKIPARTKVPEYRPEVEEQKGKAWLAQMNAKASTPLSKIYLAQLSGILSFYNNSVKENLEPIDFDEWEKRIQTPGVVSKIKENYESLSSKTYDIPAILNSMNVELSSADSSSELLMESFYSAAVWTQQYCIYLNFLSDLETYANPFHYTPLEMTDFFYGSNIAADTCVETRHINAGSRAEVDLGNYVVSQFKVVKNNISYFRHPSDSGITFCATKNVLGK